MLNPYIFSSLFYVIENLGFSLDLLTNVFLNLVLVYFLSKYLIYLNPVCLVSRFLKS